MCHCHDRPALELPEERLLHQLVRVLVHGGRGLVKHHHAGLAQQGPRQAQQLALADGEVGAALRDKLCKIYFFKNEKNHAEVILFWRKKGPFFIKINGAFFVVAYGRANAPLFTSHVSKIYGKK